MVTFRTARTSAAKETSLLLPFKEGITPRQHEVSQNGGYQRESVCVLARLNEHAFIELYKLLCLLLPIDDDVKTLFTSLYSIDQ